MEYMGGVRVGGGVIDTLSQANRDQVSGPVSRVGMRALKFVL